MTEADPLRCHGERGEVVGALGVSGARVSDKLNGGQLGIAGILQVNHEAQGLPSMGDGNWRGMFVGRRRVV